MANKYTTIECWGAAHSNAYIDNCMICAPLWGKVVVPVGIASGEEYRAHYESLTPAQRKTLDRGANRVAFNISRRERAEHNAKMMAECEARAARIAAAKTGGAQ